MQTASRRRLEENEQGFTLIELMVVVLIIAILLAIAIPTFLGARTRAQDRAAQSSARNALTTEKTFFTDSQSFGSANGADLVTLKGMEPATQWVDGAPATLVGGQVGIVAATVNGGAVKDNVLVAVKSPSGPCFYLMDEELIGATAPGTWYYVSNTCTAPATGPTTAPVVKASDAVWGKSF